ncbi:mucin-like protein 3 [Pipistrellus kuhlii]|uniref:mucin-like protein 3 n=1 Tax=Pipistrellus kuhlii TaxID=59472 RepID=UPI001E27374E|nr:mucin-like protein 3 [Pipistrellus kuhlii]
MPTDHVQHSTSAHEKTTRSPSMPTDHKSPSNAYGPCSTQHSTVATEPSTGASGQAAVHTKKTTSTNGRATPNPVEPTENPGRTTAATETIRPPVKVTGEKSISSSTAGPNKTGQVPTGLSALPTSSLKLSSIMSEAPVNQSQGYQNKDGSQGGLHAGEMRDSASFPAWAIVIVVLVAVILLLVFLGLIFLVSYMTRTRSALVHNHEDNDPEEDGGPNSYPVYLMEQQTLGVGQIPSPQ